MENIHKGYLVDTNLTPLELHDARTGTKPLGKTLVQWVLYLVNERRSMKRELEIMKNRLGELEHEVYNGSVAPTPYEGKAEAIAKAIYDSAKPHSGGSSHRNPRTGFPE